MGGGALQASAARIERDAHHLRRQPVESLLAILDEIDMLDVGGDEVLAPRALDQRKDRLTERAGLGELGEAPLALEPIGGEDQNDRLGAGDLPIKRALPIAAGGDARVLVKIRKASTKPWLRNQSCNRPACSRSRLEWLINTRATSGFLFASPLNAGVERCPEVECVLKLGGVMG